MKTFITPLIAFMLAGVGSNAFAQDGSLDLSFSIDGRVTTAIGTFDDEARAIALQGDGKILVAGHSFNSSNYDFAVVRYNSDGSIDTSFGNNGIAITPIGSGDEKARAVAMQNDGKIVVAGYTYSGSSDAIAVVRYNSNGSLDNSFDTDGIVVTAEGGYNEYAQAVGIQADGKIVVAGGVYYINNFDVRLVRYNSNGTKDNSFDGDGMLRTAVTANYNDYANAMVIQPDGKIVIGGFSNDGLNADFLLIRYHADGTPDNSFSSDGIVSSNLFGSFYEYGNGLTIQADGKLLLCGNTNNSNYDFVTLRYTTAGSLDSTFDNDGVVVTDFGTLTDMGHAVAVAVTSNGRVVVAGYRNVGTPLKFVVVKYKSNGSADSTFDSDGIVTTDFGTSGDDAGQAIAIQTDGKILVAGGSYGTQNSIAVARYNNGTGGTSTSVLLSEGVAELKCYPNPFSTQLHIESSKDFKDATFFLYSQNGQEVMCITHLSGQYISLSRNNLPEGLYYFRILEQNNIQAFGKVQVAEK